MKLLLDTYVLLYWMNGNLPDKIRRQIQKSPDIFVSMATPWEIAIKSNPPGRFNLPSTNMIEQALDEIGARLLPFTLNHTDKLYTLPLHHKDPFDRMIIVQALEENCTVVTDGRQFSLYGGLQIFWT
jgi:PIN domain nuclease of toxin-antitoxin system